MDKLFDVFVSGLITVFVNGVPTEVPRGPLDMKTMFGQLDHVVLVHSSGIPLPINDFGFLMQGLQHGESYFLVINYPLPQFNQFCSILITELLPHPQSFVFVFLLFQLKIEFSTST